MKKIAFIIQHLTNGGAERTISNLSFAMKGVFDVFVIVFDGINCTYPIDGKMINLGVPPAKNKIGKAFHFFQRVAKMKKVKKQFQFDTVISFMPGANMVNVLSKSGEKIIISERTYLTTNYHGAFYKFCIRFASKRCDMDVTLSKMVMYDLIENFNVPPHKSITIYNPIDIERISELAQQECSYTFDSQLFYFVTAGRCVKQKGQWHLIKAFSLFHQEHKNSRLLILSDGTLKEKLESLSRELRISEYVDFIGFIDNPFSYFSRSSCFVFPSLYEGLGNALLEAMVCKIPVISYDCMAGPREIIAPSSDLRVPAESIELHDCGILVPCPSDTVDFSTSIEETDKILYRAMCLVYDNKEKVRSMVKNAFTRIQEFHPQNIVGCWKQII